jgi:hypothetical protein
MLAMEFMQKGSVEGCIKDLSPEQKVMVILSGTLGLGFMHSKGIVHGDVKPSNLLLDASYHAKLSDFGASRASDGSTMTAVPVTMAYAPLEVLDEGSPTVKSDIYSLGLLAYFVITGRHPFDPTTTPLRLMRAVSAGLDVEAAGVRPELTQLLRSMVSVNPEDRPSSTKAVFETICQHEFAFFEDVDAVAIRVELAKFGVEDEFEPKDSRIERENATLRTTVEPLGREIAALRAENAALKAESVALKADSATLKAECASLRTRNERLMQLIPPDRLLELRAEEGDPQAQLQLGEKLLRIEPGRARELLRRCGLPRALAVLATADIFGGSMAAPWAAQLMEWRPQMRSARLIARGGGDSHGVRVFIDTAPGYAQTFTFIETANRNSICGAFLEPAWPVEGHRVDDGCQESFMFTLKNHLGVAPTKFPKKWGGAAAGLYKTHFFFGGNDGIKVKGNTTSTGTLGLSYQDTVGQGAAVVYGDDIGFRAARWELWQTA